MRGKEHYEAIVETRLPESIEVSKPVIPIATYLWKKPKKGEEEIKNNQMETIKEEVD